MLYFVLIFMFYSSVSAQINTNHYTNHHFVEIHRDNVHTNTQAVTNARLVSRSSNTLYMPMSVNENSDLYNISNYQNIQDFFFAVESGDNYAVAAAVSNGMSPNVRALDNITNGITALMAAASGRRVLMVDLLLYYGADPNLSSHSLGVSNITPLMIAAQLGPLQNVQQILNHGAIINAETQGLMSGNTALMAAVVNQRNDITEFLLSRGADANISTRTGDIYGITPLMMAAKSGNIQLTAMITSQPGINLHAEDSEGRNALVYAYLSGNIALIDYLVKLGLSTNYSPEKLRELASSPN